jgi:hypothetical protein
MYLAFQGGFLDFMLNPATSWILIPVLALSIPIISIALEPVKQRLRLAERREARQMYERLALEKLEVLKAGITMGYSQQELRELDSRLERLIGEDKLKKMLDPDKAHKLKAADLAAAELDAALGMGKQQV